jgi:hypothetical protein
VNEESKKTELGKAQIKEGEIFCPRGAKVCHH